MTTPALSYSFPIAAVLQEIQGSLEVGMRLVLEAPPGAGKTTQVPLALIGSRWLQGQRILMLEPRRIAARAAAQFMSHQLGEDVGQTVGYRIRFESRVSAATRIEVVTEGITRACLPGRSAGCRPPPGRPWPGPAHRHRSGPKPGVRHARDAAPASPAHAQADTRPAPESYAPDC